MASFKGKVSDTGDFKGEVNIEGVTEAGKKQNSGLLSDRVKTDATKQNAKDDFNINDYLSSMKDMFGDVFKDTFSTMMDSFSAPLKTLFGDSPINETLEKIGIGAKSKKNSENVNNRNKGAFKKLDPGNAAGFILIYNKLDDIYELLATGKGDKRKKNDSGGLGKIGNFFKGLAGLGAGLLAIAAAFVLFVGAIALAKKLDVDLLYGLGLASMFVGFSVLFVLAAKLLKRDEGAIKSLGQSMILITISLMLFGAAIFIGAMLWRGGYIEDSLPFMGMAIGFIALVTIAGIAAKKATQSLISFGVFSILLAISLSLFALGIYAVNKLISSYEDLILPGIILGTVLVIALILIPVGLALGMALPVLPLFELFAVLLGASLLVFALGIAAVKAAIGDDIVKSIKQIGAALLAILVITGAILIVSPALTAALPFMLLMMMSIGVLAITLLIAKSVFTTLQEIADLQIDAMAMVKSVGGALLGIAAIAAIVMIAGAAIFALLPAIAPAIVGMGMLLVLFASTLALTLGALALAKLSKDFTMDTVKQIGTLLLGIAEVVGVIALATIPLLFAAASATVAIAALAPILLAFTALLGIAMAVKKFAEIIDKGNVLNEKKDDFREDIKQAISACITAIKPLLDSIADNANKLNKDSRKSFEVISECLKPVMEAIMLAPDFVKKLSSPETINTIQNINPETLGETVSLLMMHVQSLLDNIGAEFKSIVGNWFKKKALEGIKPLLDELSNVINAIVGDNGIIKNIQRLTESNKNKEATNEAVQQVTQMVRDMNVLSSKIESLGDTAKAAKKASKNIGKLPDIIEDVVNSINEVSDKFSTLSPQSGTDILSIIDNVLKPFFERLPTVQMDSITQFLNAIEELTRANFKKMVKNFESLNGINFQSAISNIDGLANAVNKLSQSIKSFTENDFVGKLHELNASIQEVNASLSEKATVGMMAPEYSQKSVNNFESDTLSVSDSENKNSNGYLAKMCNILERWDTDGVKQGMTFEQRVKAEKAEARQNENAQQKLDAQEKLSKGDIVGAFWSWGKSLF